jgi:hypothetical protein
MYMSLGEVFKVFSETEMEDFNLVKNSRYYNDPPEFFTILRGHTDGLHWGYYLDDFNDLKNMYVVSYYSNDAFELNPVGNTIFEAFRQELDLMYVGVLTNMEEDPDHIEDYKKEIGSLNTIRDILITYETAERPEKGWDYDDKYQLKREITAETRTGWELWYLPTYTDP